MLRIWAYTPQNRQQFKLKNKPQTECIRGRNDDKIGENENYKLDADVCRTTSGTHIEVY